MTTPSQEAVEAVARMLDWLISNLGYPVGCGIGPHPETTARMARAILSSPPVSEWREKAEQVEKLVEALEAAERAHQVHADCEDCSEAPTDPVTCEHCFPSWNEAYELRQDALTPAKQEGGANV